MHRSSRRSRSSGPFVFVLFSLLSSFLCALFALSACDPLPDECEDDDNVCDGNVANQCQAPGAEARRMTTRIDCGAERTCVVSFFSPPSDFRLPVCADKGAPDCPNVGDRACHGNSVAVCTALVGGRRAWVSSDPCHGGCDPQSATLPSGAPAAGCRN